MFSFSEVGQREQAQPVAGSYSQESGHWREGCGEYQMPKLGKFTLCWWSRDIRADIVHFQLWFICQVVVTNLVITLLHSIIFFKKKSKANWYPGNPNAFFPLHQTCAHLYELRQRVNQSSETRDPIGRCYVLSEDLTNRDDLDGGEWKFCEGRPQGHEQFGFCQQGLSVSFTPDKNFILFGAPGTYNWKGNVTDW